jgi:3-oxoacyl-[acyl-carrier protein] reductase
MSTPRADTPVVLVTGSSRGLGRAIAIGFGRTGYRVAANYRMDSVGAVASTRAIEAEGGVAMAYQADVRDTKAVAAMVGAITGRWGRLDVLVCNAATAADEFVVRLSEDSWDLVLGTILTGAFHCLQAAGPVMQRQGGGAVVFIGSFAGMQGGSGQAPYAAAKAGMLGLMQSVAREWGPDRIRINMILPGWHATALTGYKVDVTPAPFIPVLNHGTTIAEVADFVVAVAAMPDISGQVFNLDSRILPR